MKLTRCPLCESKKIVRKTGPVTDWLDGKEIRVPHASYWHCPSCEEDFYSDEDMDRIENFSKKRRVAA